MQKDEQITTKRWGVNGRRTIGYGQPSVLFFYTLELIARGAGTLWVMLFIHLCFLVG